MEERDYKAMNEELKPELKQTAVDWLVDQLTSTTWKYVPFEERMEIFRKAKQMEEQQLNKAWQDGAVTAQNDAAKEIAKNYVARVR